MNDPQPSAAAIALEAKIIKLAFNPLPERIRHRQEIIDRYLREAREEALREAGKDWAMRHATFSDSFIQECAEKAANKFYSANSHKVPDDLIAIICEAFNCKPEPTPIDNLVNYLAEQFPATKGHIGLRVEIEKAIKDSK